MMYLVCIVYDNGNVNEFLTKDVSYLVGALELMKDDDSVCEVLFKYIKEIK